MSCCPTNIPPVISDVKPKNLPIYEAGDIASKTAIIYISDIFGQTALSQHFADILGEKTGMRIVSIDFFNGQPWPLSKYPPGPDDDLMGWIGSHDYATKVEPQLKKVIANLKYQGVEKFYSIGFCWGGLIAFKAQQSGLVEKIAALHPAFFNDEMIPAGPICLLPSKDEPPLLGLKATIEASEFAPFSMFERFDNMHHGWVGARANLTNEENAKESNRALDIVTKFFKQ